MYIACGYNLESVQHTTLKVIILTERIYKKKLFQILYNFYAILSKIESQMFLQSDTNDIVIKVQQYLLAIKVQIILNGNC